MHIFIPYPAFVQIIDGNVAKKESTKRIRIYDRALNSEFLVGIWENH